MFFPQSHAGFNPIEKADRIFHLKLGQVTGHLPGVQQVTVTFDGGERSEQAGKATAEKVNTRNVTCKMGVSVSGYRSGVSQLPPLFSWVVVGMIENTDESPVVLCCVHDDFTHILGTMASDPNKMLWHHPSDTTLLVDQEGKTEFVHPSGLRMMVFHDKDGVPVFTRHFRQIRNDHNRQLKGIKKEAATDPEKPWEEFQYYESPDGEWQADPGTGAGAWDYGPATGERGEGYDHRMRETDLHKAYLRIDHPAKGAEWRNDPAGSGGEYGSNYQTTQSYLEWNGDGEFKLHIDEFIFMELYKEGKVSIHSDETNFFLKIDPTGETAILSAKDGEVLLELDAGATKATIMAKASGVFGEFDGAALKATIQAKAGTDHLIINGTSGLTQLYATLLVTLGNATAYPLWTTLMDPLWNTHFHYDFLGIPTTPPDVTFLMIPTPGPASPLSNQISTKFTVAA